MGSYNATKAAVLSLSETLVNELRESGTHQELLGRRGIYHRLYQLQFKDTATVKVGT